MFRPRFLLFIFLLILVFTWLSSAGFLPRVAFLKSGKEETRVTPEYSFARLRSRAETVRDFVTSGKFNERICFLVDMSLPSGQNRFFVYDLKKDTLQNSGLVTHGRCNQRWLEGRKYGNTVGCGCTSLGKYRIGNAYNGKFGLAFKLHGLERTNDMAFERFVVLHAHECVPETPSSVDICQSDGCPTVAPGFLQQLKPIIRESRKPVLLWIFE